MKKRFLKTSHIVLATMLGLTAAYAGLSERAAAQGDSPVGKLEGTWRADVTFRNCQTGDVIRTVQSLITFVPPATPSDKQGSTLEQSSSTFFRSGGQGIWRHEGGPNFSTNFRFFLFNSSGVLTSTSDVTKTIVLGPGDNEYTATTSSEIRDLSGNLLQAGCATDIARRVE